MEDREIIELFEIRSEDAVSETEKKYGAYCFACAENILGDEEDAKEAVLIHIFVFGTKFRRRNRKI